MLYWCSSTTGDNDLSDHLVKSIWSSLTSWRCRDDLGTLSFNWQSYWEYSKQFWDVKEDSDWTWTVQYGASPIWDDDDLDLWDWPVAIWNNTGVQELYLISKNWDRRLFIRRALVDSWDFNHDGTTWDVIWEKRYTLQMLRLRGFDAWDKHNFDPSNSSWVYDWVIDTRACDRSYWFLCSWASINTWWAYNNYHLPKDVNDGWVSIFPWKISIDDWNLIIWPSKDPKYAWATWAVQINPYIRLYIRVRLYGWARYTKINPAVLSWYIMDLQTTFNIKSFY